MDSSATGAAAFLPIKKQSPSHTAELCFVSGRRAGSGAAAKLQLRRCDEEAHIVQLVFLEEIVEGEVVDETLGAVYAVAILVVVGGVVGIGHDDHVVRVVSVPMVS
jgi:hypothetical protein